MLLAFYLFNLVGFRWVFDAALHQSDKRFEARLDLKQYDQKDLVAVRVPLFMPYQAANKGFERIHGEVTISGVVYKYVGRKVESGDLVLYCLKDEIGSSLRSAKNAFFCNTNGLSADNPSPNRQGNNCAPTAPGLGDYDNFIAGYAVSFAVPAVTYSLPADDASSARGAGNLPEEPPEYRFFA